MTQACAFLISFSGFLMQVVRGHILKRKNTSRRMLLEVLLGLGLLLHHHLSLRHARPRFQIHVPPKYNGPASSSLLRRFSRQERSPQSQPFLSNSCSSLKVKFIGHNLPEAPPDKNRARQRLGPSFLLYHVFAGRLHPILQLDHKPPASSPSFPEPSLLFRK